MFKGDEIYEPSNWMDMGAIHATFAAKRKDDPLGFVESEIYPNFWHVTKHSDIFAVEMATDAFLNEPRSIVRTREDEARTRALNGGCLNRIRHLLTYDGDEHSSMRRLTQGWFMPKNLHKITGVIETSAEMALEALKSKGGNCNFAEDVALEYPFRVVMRLLGVPEQDHARILRAALALFGAEDPKVRARYFSEDVDMAETRDEAIREFQRFIGALIADRTANPRDDLSTLIATAEINGVPVDMAGKMGYFIIVATAGHDTTSNSLTEAMHQLALDPALFARLKADPDTVAPLIVEEAIRYAAPVRHFVRTAKKDFQLRDKTIKEGDCVVLWYPSGSRDEEVFPNPDQFDIDRNGKTRHASFGHGAHLCLGMHLARMEITTFLKSFATAVSSVELMGEPTYSATTLVGGINDLPIKVEFS